MIEAHVRYHIPRTPQRTVGLLTVMVCANQVTRSQESLGTGGRSHENRQEESEEMQ